MWCDTNPKYRLICWCKFKIHSKQHHSGCNHPKVTSTCLNASDAHRYWDPCGWRVRVWQVQVQVQDHSIFPVANPYLSSWVVGSGDESQQLMPSFWYYTVYHWSSVSTRKFFSKAPSPSPIQHASRVGVWGQGWASVGEVQFGLVWALFGQTGNQMVQFEPGFAKTEPKPIETDLKLWKNSSAF